MGVTESLPTNQYPNPQPALSKFKPNYFPTNQKFSFVLPFPTNQYPNHQPALSKFKPNNFPTNQKKILLYSPFKPTNIPTTNQPFPNSNQIISQQTKKNSFVQPFQTNQYPNH